MGNLKLLQVIFAGLSFVTIIFLVRINLTLMKDTSYKASKDVEIAGNKNESQSSTQNKIIAKTNPPVYIVYYRFGKQTNKTVKEGQDLGGCIATFNESLLPRAKAVVIHRFCSNSKEIIPRYPNQIFVFFTMESPPHTRYNEKRFTFEKFDNGFINWTMSYRTDSDVFKPYFNPGAARSLLARNKEWVDKNLSRKKELALWIVSDCDLTQGAVLRMEYAKELMKAGLPITTYGQCFGERVELDDSLNENLRSYKFYLAFENGLHCKDYMTEKFWGRGIINGRVPVVWGPSKEDVKKLAPPDSYIHTEDFDSPASLASYLLYLDKNDTAYREYFRWLEKPDSRTEAFAKLHENTGNERLCEMVLSGQPRKTIDSITDFVYGKETEDCLIRKPK